jgi:PAS domain S-box-containing protein
MTLSWLYPKPTGDPGRDRNIRTIQFTCLLFSVALGITAALDLIAQEWELLPLLVMAVVGFGAAAVMNRTGRSAWAARTVLLAFLLMATLLVFQARDGFRSLAMFLFPALLLISVMLLDRNSYLTAASIILVTVAALGVAEKRGLTRAIPGVRSPTSYESIFYVEVFMLVFAVVGSRIARDAQTNVFELRATIDRLSEANFQSTEIGRSLRESEERFRNMADAAPVMIWVSGLDKRSTFFNKPWLDFTERTLEQELGKGLTEGVHPEDLDRCRAIYYSSFDDRRAFQMEYRLRRSDGEYRWLFNNGTPLYRGGEFVGFIGSCIDITERNLIQERLRASEIQLKDAQRLAKVGSWERRIDTALSQWSDEIRRILGVSSDAPANFATFINCVHPNDREKVVGSDRKACSSSGPVEVEYRIAHPDGEVRFAHSVFEALRNDQGIAVRIVGATQDITEQVKARELLRESEERLKDAERIAHLGHWQWDLKNGQVIWSEGCYRVFAQPRDFIPTREGVLQLVLPRDRERIERGTRKRLAEKKGGSIEFRIVRPDGEIRTVQSVSEVVLGEDGQPAYVFGTCQDITDVRHAQEESFARQKLESVGTLASGIAHDFNNILGGVVATAELAQADCAAGSYPEDELKVIRDVAMRGSEIVRQLMIYAGKESAVVELVDVSYVVQEMLELLKVSMSKRAVLEIDLGKDLPTVRANAAQLRQIVMNLVTNASDAMENRDGVIHVSTRYLKVARDSGVISDRLAEGDYVQLEVSDTGHGMSPEIQAKAFDPFFSTKSRGRGLGLAVVHGLFTVSAAKFVCRVSLTKARVFRSCCRANKPTRDRHHTSANGPGRRLGHLRSYLLKMKMCFGNLPRRCSTNKAFLLLRPRKGRLHWTRFERCTIVLMFFFWTSLFPELQVGTSLKKLGVSDRR